MVVGVEARDLGEGLELDLVLEDLGVREVLVGPEQEDVGDLALEEREAPLDVDGADVLFQLAAAGAGDDPDVRPGQALDGRAGGGRHGQGERAGEGYAER